MQTSDYYNIMQLDTTPCLYSYPGDFLRTSLKVAKKFGRDLIKFSIYLINVT